MAHNPSSSANSDTAAEARAWLALRNAASDCGSGLRSIDPQPLRTLPAGRKWAGETARVIVDGLVAGSLSAPAQLAAGWDRFGGAITELIIELGKVWDNPGAARRIQYQLEQMLLEADDLAAPRILARTLGIRVDARNPAATELPEGIDQIYAHLMMDGQIEAVVQFGERRHRCRSTRVARVAERCVGLRLRFALDRPAGPARGPGRTQMGG